MSLTVGGMKLRVMIVHRGIDADPRCAKIIDALYEQGHEILFVGWDSRPEVLKPKFSAAPIKSSILNCATPLGFKAILKVHRYLWHIYRNLLQFRPEVIHCVNEEVALMLLPAKGLIYKKLVVDIFDSLVLRVRNVNRIGHTLLNMCCDMVYRAADLLIVTDEARYFLMERKYQPKSIIVENTIDGEPISCSFNETGRVIICVTGCLSRSRGLEQLLIAVEAEQNVEVIAMGLLVDEFSKDIFCKHKNVRYLGFMSQREALQKAATCDAIYAFYEPVSTNNIYASPNKIFDAMCVGKPVLINSETIISKWIVDEGLGYSVPYYKTDLLRNVLRELKEKRIEEKQEFQQIAHELFRRKCSWNMIKKRLQTKYELFIKTK